MSCNNLTVSVNRPNTTIFSGGCDHGHVESATPTMIVMSNTGYYGPDGRIVIQENGTTTAIYEVQQNYCFLEAGSVTVTKLSGKDYHFVTTEGSYSTGDGGQVQFT